MNALDAYLVAEHGAYLHLIGSRSGDGEGHDLCAVVEVASLSCIDEPHVGLGPFMAKAWNVDLGGNRREFSMLVGVREFGEKSERRGLGIVRGCVEWLSFLDKFAYSRRRPGDRRTTALLELRLGARDRELRAAGASARCVDGVVETCSEIVDRVAQLK